MFSAYILFFLITGTFFLQCMSQKQVHLRGTPEVDYPTYYAIPTTSFRCSDQLYNPGFYADTEARCQVFHYCYEHRQESFLCPMGTIFNQPILACDYWYSSNCSLATSYYNVNAIKRRNEEVFEVEDPEESQSDNLFDKMAGLYETNKTPESPVLNNDSVTPENEVLGKGVGTSSELFSENNNKVEDYNKYSYDKQLNMVDEKQLEIVKYDIAGLNSVNGHKGSKNERPYEIDNMEDFIFSEDGMLHRSQEINPSQEDIYQVNPSQEDIYQTNPSQEDIYQTNPSQEDIYQTNPSQEDIYQTNPSQEDIYQTNPTDMSFDQGYSGYAEIPSEENFNFDSNEELDFESYFQSLDFDLQKRRSDMNGNYVRRRPSNRKPIVIPEEEPEIVQLPVTKHKRKPIVIDATVSTNDDSGASHEETSDDNIYFEETVSVANEGLEDTASGEFSLDEQNWNRNYNFNDPKIFYETPEEIKEENNSQQYVLSNVDEDEISSVFGSESKDLLSISNIELSTLANLNYGDESEIFTQTAEGTDILPFESSDTNVDNGSSFDSDGFPGSGSEENIQPHLSEGSIFPEDQKIFSDSEDIEISDMETSYKQPISLSDTFEGSGISFQESIDMSNFSEEVNDPSQFVSEYDSKDNPDYEASFSSETFGKFSLPESSENNNWVELVPADSGESNEFNYLQESSDQIQDNSDKTLPEIREIDGTYYIFSDSEYQPNDVYGDSSEIYSENGDYEATENLDYLPDRMPEEFIDSVGSRYVLEDPNLKIDRIEETLHNMDYQHSSALENLHLYQDSRPLENAHEKLSDEFETETSPDVLEEYTADDSETPSQLTTEDVTFLEIMSQTPVPMLKNLFEVSEKSSSDAIEDEILRTEIIPSDQDIVQDPEEQTSSKEVDEFESHLSDTADAEASDESSSSAVEDEIPHTEIISSEKDIIDENHEDQTSSEEPFDFESFFSNISSDTEENLVDMESDAILSETLGTGHEFEEEASNADASGQDGLEVLLPEKKLEVFVPRKEADPFNPLFSEGTEILVGSKGKQNSSLKAAPIELKNGLGSLVKSKDLKAVGRGKRLSENLQTFNPPKKGDPVRAPSRETFRETMFTKIPSEFLKMKHSSIRPYFYNYGLKNSGFKPRAGDPFESSKLSKLKALGKRLLEAKSSKFNIVKKYIDSYRNY